MKASTKHSHCLASFIALKYARIDFLSIENNAENAYIQETPALLSLFDVFAQLERLVTRRVMRTSEACSDFDYDNNYECDTSAKQQVCVYMELVKLPWSF